MSPRGTFIIPLYPKHNKTVQGQSRTCVIPYSTLNGTCWENQNRVGEGVEIWNVEGKTVVVSARGQRDPDLGGGGSVGV